MTYEIKEIVTPQNYVGIKENEMKNVPSEFQRLKKKHPGALILFRMGDFYETYCDDAEECSKILGITLTRMRKDKGGYRLAGFPHHALDTYLPKLIRAGHRVAICDQI